MSQKSSLASSFRKMFGRSDGGTEFDQIDELGDVITLSSASSGDDEEKPEAEMVLGAGQMVAEDDTTADPGFDELAASARLRASAASVIAEFEATEPESREDTDDSPGSDEIRAFLAAVNAGVSGQGAEDEADAPVGGVGATTDEPPAGTDAVPEADPAVTAEIEPPEEAETPEPGAAHQGFDPDSMKAMIREVLQAELQGETGRNLSRNIQILVRNEIDTALKRKK